MRALKIAGIVAAALVGLIIIGIAALLLFVDPNDYRDDIAKLVEEKTGRPLQIRGELGLKVFPWIAIDLNDVTLGNPPGYGEEPFLTVRKATVGVKLLPLLNKRVEVSRVGIDGLAVTLISRGEEENNWKDLGGSESTEESSGGTTQATIAGLDVTNSMLVYRDEAKKSVMRLMNLEARTGALGGNAPTEAEIRFDYDEGAAPTVAQVALKARAQMLNDGSRLELKDLEGTAKWFGAPEEGAPAAGSAKAASAERAQPLELSVRSAAVSVDLNAETLAPATFAVEVGKLPVELTAQGEKLFGEYVIGGKLSIARTSARELMKSFGIEPPVTSDPKALSAFALATDYRLTENQLALPALDVTLDDTRVRGSVSVDDLETLALRFDLDVNAINLDRYMEPEPQEAKGGGGSAPAEAAQAPPTELPLDAVRKLNVRGQLRIGQATVAKLPFTDIRLPLEARDGRAHLGPTQAKLFGGSYNGDIIFDARQPQAVLSVDEHARGIDIGALMKAGFETDRVAGRGDASAKLTARGKTDAELFKSLSGQIAFNVADGAIMGFDLWYEIQRALAVFKRQPLPERAAGAPRTAFNALSGSAVVDKGVLRNDDLVADLTYIKARGKGTLALESQAVDYRLVAEVYKLPEGGSAQLADLKAAEIPVTISGTLADMKVRPDVQGYLESRFKKQVNEKVEEKKEDIRKKLDEKLKGLFNR
ncbi:MAG: AsmA family protein [Steroidobacteraceae bacterium]|nr:AsmA family protein [Steroidobacteraceae bacterium]